MAMSVKHWQDPLALVLGLWMGISPWVLGHSAEPSPTWNAVILGVLIVLAALVALFRARAWQEWANAAFGLWLVISPWALGFSGAAMAMWNAVIVGVLVLALAVWTLATDKDIGGWWSPAT